MAVIHLVRHGQASFGRADYDQLSATGFEQGRVLGQCLAAYLKPTATFTGRLLRQQQTLAAVAEAYGPALPTPRVLAGLDEFDHEVMMARYRPEWADTRVMAAAMAREAHPGKAFQKVFSLALERWAFGVFDEEYPETWGQFQARVIAALEQAIAEGGGGDLLMVTSGGPIAVMVQHLLGLDAAGALAMNEKLANAGVTRVLYSATRRSLQVFNNFAHLEAVSPRLVTYR